MITPCSCRNDFQDKTYGKGKRVYNFAPKATGGGGYRCTVCGKVKSLKEAGVTKEEEK